MRIPRPILYLGLFLALLGILAAGLHTLTQDNNLGTDFYIFWQAGRAVFLEGASPYSDEIAIRSQLAIFKRLSGPDEDQLAFVYPPFALIPLLPVLFMPFDWAQASWIAFLLLSLVAAFLVAYPRAPLWVGISLLAFYPVFFGTILGNYAIALAGLIVILFGAYLPRKHPPTGWQVLAGVSVAWLAIKPQLTWPFMLLFWLYEIRERRWKTLLACGFTFLLLVALSFALLPAWPAEWLGRITRYTAYNQAWLIATFLLKQVLPVGAATVLTGVLAILCAGLAGWLGLLWWRGRANWLLLVAWLGFCGYLFHPRGASYEHVAFLIPLALWICTRPRPSPRSAIAWWVASLAMSWLAFFFSVGPNAIPAATEWPVIFHLGWIAWLAASKNLVMARQV